MEFRCRPSISKTLIEGKSGSQGVLIMGKAFIFLMCSFAVLRFAAKAPILNAVFRVVQDSIASVRQTCMQRLHSCEQ
jgi:hypothetical protein